MGKNFRSKDNFRQLYYMLSNPIFTQRQMARDLEIPHGYKISSFVSWLEEIGYVSQTVDPTTKSRAYEVRSPVALIDFFSRFRRMTNLFVDSFEIGNDVDEVINYLNKHGAIFCLTTALSYHDEYFRDPLIHAYTPNTSVLEDLSKKGRGSVKVNLYAYDLEDKFIIKKGMKITSHIRTVIDLFCDNKAYAAEQLIKRLWG